VNFPVARLAEPGLLSDASDQSRTRLGEPGHQIPRDLGVRHRSVDLSSLTMTDTQSTTIDLIHELEWRGLLKDCTDKDGLRDHLRTGTRKIYAGFDPTADSLTIGNLVPIMLLAHVKRAGHTPVVVMGGGTGLIGDPSGKSAERQMMTEEMVQHNVDSQRPIYDAVLGPIAGPEHELKNNNDWLSKISYIEALRDIGKHFSVNMMMQKESVKDRLNNREQGISYTEFSYMILQAYDFAHLYEHEGVTVQLGGSDQYGNIVAGGDLIRRLRVQKFTDISRSIFAPLLSDLDEMQERHPLYKSLSGIKDTLTNMEESLLPDSPFWSSLADLVDRTIPDLPVKEVLDFDGNSDASLSDALIKNNLLAYQLPCFGLTAPLVSKADGGKFGKTETGAIWLTANRTSPYAYYQFWLNASDDDAANWIKVFTFMPQGEVESLIAAHSENPGKRELQRRLAQEATTILHGRDKMPVAEAAGKALFTGDINTLDNDTFLAVFLSVPTTEHAKAELADGVDMVGLLKEIGLASSNREAREFLNEGSVSINGQKITIDTKLTEDHLLHESYIAIRRGKKKWHLTKWA
jgi:tyrosyl-tRNA synthetase